MAILLIAFFCSGIAGLSYEITWLRYLMHLFGGSTPAVSATVATFLTGLAIGAAIGGRVFERRRNPVVAYAILEVLIAVCAVPVPYAMGKAEHLVTSGATTATSFAVAAAILIVPTTLLGATFPAMAAVLRHRRVPASATGTFYGLNTLGAVVGVITAAFWALPTLGLATTNLSMAGVNVFVAGLAFLARGAVPTAEPTSATTDETTTEAPEDGEWIDSAGIDSAGIGGKTAAVAALMSGLLAIAIEVLWVRALVLSFPGTVYVFALVLAAFLVGIGAGALAVALVFVRYRPRAQALGLAYLAAGVGAAFAQWAMPQLLPWSIGEITRGAIAGWRDYVVLVGSAALGIMTPAALAMGAALPILIGLAQSRERRAVPAGRLYALNTLGGVAGSILGIYLLLPTFGLARSLTLLAFGYVALALIVVRGIVVRGLAIAVGVAGVIAIVVGLEPEPNPGIDARGKTIARLEAPAATVTVYQQDDGVRGLTVNASYLLSDTDKRTVSRQYRLGFLPMLAHPAPKRALLVGFATGATLAAMVEHDALERLDCVEILGASLTMAPHFAAINHRVQEHEKARVIVGDGRRFLMAPGPAYDVIVTDLYSPRTPGVGALYSREHFARVRDRLGTAGVFVCWLPLWQMGKTELAAVVRAFVTVFPDAEGWIGDWSQKRPVLGLAARRGERTKLDYPFERKLALATRDLLRRAFPKHRGRFDLDFPLRPTGRGFIAPGAVAKMVSDRDPINTLDTPIVEFSAPRSLLRERLAQDVPLALENILTLQKARTLDRTPWQRVPRTIEQVRQSLARARKKAVENTVSKPGERD